MDNFLRLNTFNKDSVKVLLIGKWVLSSLDEILKEIRSLRLEDYTHIFFDLSGVMGLDVSGAYVFKSLVEGLRKQKKHVEIYNISNNYLNLLELIQNNQTELDSELKNNKLIFLLKIGEHFYNLLGDIVFFLSFFGEICLTFFRLLIKPKKIRWKEVLYEIENTGVYAVPIVALVAVLSGIVISYQGAAQLSKFGANIFIVDLIGLSIAREMSPLLTSIMVAGRSGSSYTARIGSMILNDEIDALRTIGISPIELLVMPKFFAMIICLPLLIFVADIVGIGGGLFISHMLLNLNFHTLIFRLKSSLSITSFLIGILKGPIFAIPIVFISCFRGFHVKNSSEELGKYTTMSVVNTIFFVIILDALLSIIFQKIGI